MNISPETMQLAAMLDDRDENTAVNLLAQLLAREEELGELPGILQEHPDPLVRRRAHLLQNAMTMRRRRRTLCAMLNGKEKCSVFDALKLMHLLWFDKDQAEDLDKETADFLKLADKHPMDNLTDVEIFMRKYCFLPENETTIRPESYCIGTVIYHRLGASSILMAMIHAMLNNPERFKIIHTLGIFGIADTKKNQLLSGGGSWKLNDFCAAGTDILDIQQLLRYIAVTLLSCAVNSDSYRYVMSITQALTGDESEHVFDDFPYPYWSNPEVFEPVR